MKEIISPHPLEDMPFIPKGSDIRHVNEGEMSDVYILDEEGLVVKLPREPRVTGQDVLREALVVAELQNRDEAPLMIPELRECAVEKPFYSIFTKVEGTTLGFEDIKEFSPAERQLLGQKIGAFVAWMATALPFDDYKNILRDTNTSEVWNHSMYLRQVRGDVLRNLEVREALGHVVCELWAIHQSFEAKGLLEPTVIGHNDLHCANITFIRQGGMRVPYGVIDFGLTQPSTPEYNLRHLAIYGKDISQAAADEYERITDCRPNPSVIAFWAIVQRASFCAYVEARGKSDQYPESFEKLRMLLLRYGEMAGLDPRSYEPGLLEI